MEHCAPADVKGDDAMRYGYWMPVFGGWLRNVDDEHMEATWAYVRDLAIKSEQWGYDLSLIAELHMNDIKGISAPAPESLAAAGARPSDGSGFFGGALSALLAVAGAGAGALPVTSTCFAGVVAVSYLPDSGLKKRNARLTPC